jgi:hypothetical protein
MKNKTSTITTLPLDQQLIAAEVSRVKAEKNILIIKSIMYFNQTIDKEISDDTALCDNLLQKHALLSTALKKKVESRACVLHRVPQAVEECIQIYNNHIISTAEAEIAAAEAAAAELAAAEMAATEMAAAETALAEAKKREMEVL